jgi:hypothetical protein
MTNQNKFASLVSFFLGSIGFFNSLLAFMSALKYRGLENNFLADNWEVPLTIFLVFVFALGWWSEVFIEYLIKKSGRKMLFSFLIILFLYSLIMLPSFLFPLGFFRLALSACGYVLLSGFFYKFSLLRPEVVAKLRS